MSQVMLMLCHDTFHAMSRVVMCCQVKLDKLMTKLDTDGDGKITLEEFRGLFKQMKQ